MPIAATTQSSQGLAGIWNWVRKAVRGDAADPSAAISKKTAGMTAGALASSYGCGGKVEEDFFEPPPPDAAQPRPEQADPAVGEESLHPDAGVTEATRRCEVNLNRFNRLTGNSVPLIWRVTRADGTQGCSKMSVTFESFREQGDGTIAVRAVGRWASAPLGGWPDGQEFASIRQDNVPISDWLDTEASHFPALRVPQTPDGGNYTGADLLSQVSLHYVLNGNGHCDATSLKVFLRIQNMVGDSSRASGLFFLASYAGDTCTVNLEADGGQVTNESFVLTNGAPLFYLEVSAAGRVTEVQRNVWCREERQVCEFPFSVLGAEDLSVGLAPDVHLEGRPDGGVPDGGP